MGFSEKVKEEVRKKCNCHCVICNAPFVEIHHIIPKAEGGSDDIDNAAPLCSSCHDLYGANPTKRKQIREMRNQWYEVIENRFKDDVHEIEPYRRNDDNFNVLKNKGIAVYHVIYADESFEDAAKAVLKLIREAQEQYPNQKRFLYIDIEGHRNEEGGFDWDMLEFQKEFALGFLMRYLTQLSLPLGKFESRTLQSNEVPDELEIWNANKL